MGGKNLSLFVTNTRIFAPLCSKQYCIEINNYSFFQTIRHQSTKIAPTPIPPLPPSLPSHLLAFVIVFQFSPTQTADDCRRFLIFFSSVCIFFNKISFCMCTNQTTFRLSCFAACKRNDCTE